MSDNWQGPGWWQAADGKWYPPQPGQGTPAYTPGSAKKSWYQNSGLLALVVVLVLVTLIAPIAYFATRSSGHSSSSGPNVTSPSAVGSDSDANDPAMRGLSVEARCLVWKHRVEGAQAAYFAEQSTVNNGSGSYAPDLPTLQRAGMMSVSPPRVYGITTNITGSVTARFC